MIGEYLALEMKSKGKFKVRVPNLKKIMGEDYDERIY